MPQNEFQANMASKRAIKSKWVERGRWDRFVKLRDGRKKILDALGELLPTEAARQAWTDADEAMEEAWASGTGADVGEDMNGSVVIQGDSRSEDGDVPIVDPLTIEKTGNWRDQIEWVAANIETRSPDPKTCPSPAAWNLWKHAGNRKSDFWTKTYALLKPTKAETDVVDRMSDDGREIKDRVNKILAILEKVNGNAGTG